VDQNQKDYWNEYYKKYSKPGLQSPFANFVKPFLQDKTSMVELGCGNGRDALFFSQNSKINYLAIDQCQNEVDFLNNLKENRLNLTFEANDFTNLLMDKKFNYIYSRFTLHSVDREGEINVLNWASNHLLANGMFFIEVRSTEDEFYGQGKKVGVHEFISDHYRRFVVMQEMIDNGVKAGLKLIYSIQDKDLAPYKEENPEVIRLIFQNCL